MAQDVIFAVEWCQKVEIQYLMSQTITRGSSGQKRRSAGFTVENMTYHELIIEARRIFDKAPYYDHDARILASAEAILDMLGGKARLCDEVQYGRARISGNIGKVTRLHDIRLRERVR